MKTFKGDFKILNEYQASSRKNFPLGTDYSFDYTYDKGIMLYIGDDYLESTISFKAFIKDFTLSTTVTLSKAKQVSGQEIDVKGVGISYSVSLSIPALSVDDAMVNAGRLEELDRIVGGGLLGYSALEYKKASERPKRVLLSNLIHNGLYKEKHHIQYFSQVKKYGAKCYFFGNSYSVDTTMGFFEYEGKLWPKAYDLKLDLSVDAEFDVNGDTSIIRGFDEDMSHNNYYSISDVRTWPFGVS